jgi:hypothetical protein
MTKPKKAKAKKPAAKKPRLGFFELRTPEQRARAGAKTAARIAAERDIVERWQHTTSTSAEDHRRRCQPRLLHCTLGRVTVAELLTSFERTTTQREIAA